MKKNRGIATKRYEFESDIDAIKFQRYIDFRNDTGVIVRCAFDEIDRRGAKLITKPALKMALRIADLEVAEDEIEFMSVF
jgi:hypothetical protein